MKPVALLDGDIYLYTATAAVQRVQAFDEQGDMIGPYCFLSEAKDAFMQAVSDDLKNLKRSRTILCLSAPTNFRKALYPAYKSNRKNKPKPFGYIELREWARKKFETKEVPNLEADDVLGVLATRGVDAVIFSRDKDMLTLPAKLWRDGKVRAISEDEANYNWLRQTLTGDATDGYPGCPGAGPKKAESILAEAGGIGTPTDLLWQAVVAAFEKAGLTAEDALLQARMARILRASDWNQETRELRLWSPPGQGS